jgi:thiol-disulfide isomerase/thioredoxin
MVRRAQTVAISADVFQSGQSYSDYRQHLLDDGGPAREKLQFSEESLAKATLDLDAFSHLDRPVRVLVLSEDWCGDCTDNLPILNRIAEETGKLDVRILHRDEHPDIADQYLKEGKFRAIPTMVFLDEDFKDLGVFIERPDSVTNLRAERKAAVFAEHPEFGSPDTPASELPDEVRSALSTALAESRASTRPFAIQEVVRAIGDIVSGPKKG